MTPFHFPGAGENFQEEVDFPAGGIRSRSDGRGGAPDLAERLRSVEAACASDTEEYHRNLAAVEAQLVGERTHRTRVEADLAKQEAGRQAMEKALDGDFPRIPFF